MSDSHIIKSIVNKEMLFNSLNVQTDFFGWGSQPNVCVCVSGISYIMGTKCQFSAYGSIFGPHEENSLQIIVFLKI